MLVVDKIYRGSIEAELTNSGGEAIIDNGAQAYWWHASISVHNDKRYFGINVWAEYKGDLLNIVHIFDDKNWTENPFAWLAIFISDFDDSYVRKNRLYDRIASFMPILETPGGQDVADFNRKACIRRWNFLLSDEEIDEKDLGRDYYEVTTFAGLLYRIFKAGYRSAKAPRDNNPDDMVYAAGKLLNMVPPALKPPLRKLLNDFVVTREFL